MSAEVDRDDWADRDLVFASYSRDDAEWLQAFRIMLDPILADRGVRLWADTDVQVGDEWDSEIETAIARSGLALVLVSARYLASTYIRDRELFVLRSQGAASCDPSGLMSYEQRRELADVQWLHDPIRDGALNLTGNPGERDRQITLACRETCDAASTAARSDQIGVASKNGQGGASGTPACCSHAWPAQQGSGPTARLCAPERVDRASRSDYLGGASCGRDNGTVSIAWAPWPRRDRQVSVGRSCSARRNCEEPVPGRNILGQFRRVWKILTAQLDLLRRLDSSLPAPRTPSDADRYFAQNPGRATSATSS